MSLLGSIFGGDGDQKAESTSEGLSGIFGQSAQLPDRPRHVPKPRPAKRKTTEEDEAPAKKRKPRKPKTAKEEEGETNKESSTENPDEKESIGDEDLTIFVGNLPLKSTTRKSLAALFKDCGAISSTRIRSIPVKGVKLPPQKAGDQNLMRKVSVNTQQIDFETQKDTVQGYVVFKDIASVGKALELNNALVVEGHRIRVDKASPTIDPSRSVFCGNLPYGTDENSLRQHFIKGCDFDGDDVVGVRVIRDKETFQCKGFGYILLKEKSLVPTALKLHETTYMKKQIRVLVCGKRFKGNKTHPAGGKQKSKKNTDKDADTSEGGVTVGAFRRILGKQANEAAQVNKRKRGMKKPTVNKKSSSGLSKRAARDKKVDSRVKKLQKRVSKGMGKARR